MPRVYQVASGTRNPLRMREFVEEGATYFAAHPLRDRWGQPIATPSWRYPSRDEVLLRARGALKGVEAAQWLIERLPLGARTTPLSDRLNETRSTLERSLDLVDLYGIYTQADAIFDTAHVTEVWESLPQKDRKLFPFDPAGYDWHHYCQDVHFPTVVRMSRAQTAPRPQPSGATTPKAESAAAVQLIARRAGRSDVLAVFDIDGTLVDTNVVEYLVWMRLRSQEVSDWPAFAWRVLQDVPRWLYLERRSRAEFQRSFYRQYDALDAAEIRRLGREALEAVTLRRMYPEGLRRVRAHRRAGHRVLLLTGALDVVAGPLAEMLEVDLECARLQTDDGRYTGDLEAPPPAGEARATLLDRYANTHSVNLAESFAYADSLSDLPMLENVGVPVVVNPDARLSSIAAQRGWRVERWRTTPGNWSLPIPDPREHRPLESTPR
jgi:HAD superfamily hydrolase (TIGR01490 family)